MPKVTDTYINTRRQQIIDAAYRCFSKKGFHQATMRDIFAEAGLSAGAVYRYFNSKEEIIEASFIHDYQRSLPIFESAGDLDDHWQSIEHLIVFFYSGLQSASERGADRVNIQGWGEALVNPRLHAPLHKTFLDFRDILANLIRRLQESKKLQTAIDPEAAAEVIISSYIGLALQKAVRPELDVNEYQATVLQLLRRMFDQTH